MYRGGGQTVNNRSCGDVGTTIEISSPLRYNHCSSIEDVAMNFHGVFISLLLGAALVSAERIATTDDGKKVLLNENGTWRYLEAGESPQGASGRISLIEIIKNDRAFDFRRVRWGMSRKEVLASEAVPPVKNDASSVEYTVQFLGYDCAVEYTFINDALTRAGFKISQPHVDPALYYKDYEDLKKYLAPMYGIAVSDKCDWKNEMYRQDRSKWGFAVSLGFLTCMSRWRNARTEITLTISGGNHRIATNLEYSALKKQ